MALSKQAQANIAALNRVKAVADLSKTGDFEKAVIHHLTQILYSTIGTEAEDDFRTKNAETQLDTLLSFMDAQDMTKRFKGEDKYCQDELKDWLKLRTDKQAKRIRAYYHRMT